MSIITETHEIEQIQAELLLRLANDWALLTVGTESDYNTMTIAWGSFGDMWWKPVIDCYVVPTRYTYSFLERYDTFTVSFFPKEYHEDLQLLGSKSGRDGDKVALTSLTPQPVEGGMTFEQADTTLVCKTIYRQPLDAQAIPEFAISAYYQNMDPHELFIGQIESVIR